MCENNHPALKLFGRNIPVPDFNIPTASDLVDTRVDEKSAQPQYSSVKDTDKQDRASVIGDDKEASEALVLTDENYISPRLKREQAQISSNDQDKVVKKSDKILRCPRCNSFDTKFCYFNNYNVNQPRHFCKNCQRYWTVGGTVRNVPLGAGRKKNKLLASQYHQILVSSNAFSANRIETSDMVNRQHLSSGDSMMACEPSVGDSAFLKFGSGAPLCESMKIELNLGDPYRCARGSVASVENGEKPYSCGTSLPPSSNSNIASNKNFHQRENTTEGGSFDQFKQMPLFNCNNISPRLFPWNSGWNNGASMTTIQKPSDPVYVSKSSSLNLGQWCSGPLLEVPGFCGPNMPLQLMSAPNQRFMPLPSVVGGNVSLTARGGCPSASSSTSNSCCSSNSSPTLGKHSRDTTLSGEEKTEKKCVLLSKALKTDDKHNTLKSPLRATFGINPNQNSP